MTRPLNLICSTLLLLATAEACLAGHSIEGLWLTANGAGWMEIRSEGGTPGGFIAGSPHDPDRLEPQRLDANNPDPALRDRPLHGLQIIHSLRQVSENRWKGRIYDPNSGKTYKCVLSLADINTLNLRGYLGISIFGRTEVWTRER